MNNRQKILSSAVIMACGVLTHQAQAALAANAILKFDNGAKACVIGGTAPSACLYGITATTGSWFSMDSNGDGTAQDSEKTAISLETGIALGIIQPASGTHSGAPDGTESPSVDQPWSYFGNTGMHQTTSAITIASDNGAGAVTLNMAGWSVTWNGLADIPMGGDPANFSSDTGVATLTCYSTYTDDGVPTTNPDYSNVTDCGAGGTVYFALDLSSHVPKDGAGTPFASVPYSLHMEGTVFVPPVPTTSNSSIGNGTYASNASSTDMRVSMDDLTSTSNGNGIIADSGYTFNGGLYDFTVTTAGGAAAVVMLPLTAPIPANAVYRKYNGTSWVTFIADGSNKIASTAKVSSSCPAVGNAAYNHTNGLVENDECLQITIVNDGPYDTDTASNTTVNDPGGVAAAVQTQVDARTSSTSGCSLSETPVKPGERADWWLVAGFLGALGWLRYFRRKAM